MLMYTLKIELISHLLSETFFSQNFEKSYRGKSVEGSLKFTEFLLKEAQVALVPGIAFGADANTRMAFATSLENIQKGLERIGNALDLLQ